MEQHLKKRIIGAIIIVLFIAIVMPIILDRARTHELLETRVPDMPQVTMWSTPEYDQTVREEVLALDNGEASNAIVLPATPVVEKDDPAPIKKQPATDAKESQSASSSSKEEAQAWTLQLGAFADRENAHRLRDNLRQQGYKTYVLEMGDNTRVYVGPEQQREKAEKLRDQLSKKFELGEILIRRYVPET
ncbi:MAG: SPOR domain-containing protein [Oleibacter sp.]|nr:SPOR domain-containing protein [Thalassolituus sp.]